jgi:hypothetical protein
MTQMTTAQKALISICTKINLMNGSEDFNSVHSDFLQALKLVKSHATILISEEAEAFAEVLRRRNLIKVA